MAPKAKRNQARIGQLFSVDKKQSALLDSKVARKVEKDADIVDIKLEEPEKVVKAPKVETEPKQSRPRLDVNDPRYLRALEKATEEELCEPTDVDERDVVERLLRSFDFTASFGPVAGVNRLERWERAQRLGKNPPEIIREILQTEEGTTQARYRESYLYGHF